MTWFLRHYMLVRWVAVIAIALLPAFAKAQEPQDVTAEPNDSEIDFSQAISDDANVEIEFTSDSEHQIEVTTTTQALPDFWIGVSGEAISETLSAQLGLDHGVVVTDVMKESPAAAAGLKPHDIVTSLAGKPVRTIQDFFQPIADSQGQPLALTVVRASETETLTVTPAKRRVKQRPWPNLERAERMLFVYPGTVTERFGVPHSGPNENALAMAELLRQAGNDVSVEIRKQGDQPAKITVRRGAETWETTEDRLDALPEFIRGQANHWLNIEALVPRDARRVRRPLPPLAPRWVPAPPHAPPPRDGTAPMPATAATPASPPTNDLRREVDELKQMLRTLSEQVAQLNQAITQQPPDTPPATDRRP